VKISVVFSQLSIGKERPLLLATFQSFSRHRDRVVVLDET
jgi:hypothetical protein